MGYAHVTRVCDQCDVSEQHFTIHYCVPFRLSGCQIIPSTIIVIVTIDVGMVLKVLTWRYSVKNEPSSVFSRCLRGGIREKGFTRGLRDIAAQCWRSHTATLMERVE